MRMAFLPGGRGRRLAAFGVTALALLALNGCDSLARVPQTAAASAKPLASAGTEESFNPKADLGPAPNVDLVTLDRAPLNLAKQDGKVVLVYLTPW